MLVGSANSLKQALLSGLASYFIGGNYSAIPQRGNTGKCKIRRGIQQSPRHRQRVANAL
jgi:hypothetical protein